MSGSVVCGESGLHDFNATPFQIAMFGEEFRFSLGGCCWRRHWLMQRSFFAL